MSWYVYIVECADGTLYTGITTDVRRRVRQHNKKAKGGAKYTSTRAPVTLRYVEEAEDRSAASKREHQIKKLSREQKMKLGWVTGLEPA